MLNLAASAVDGGPSMLAQRATLAALEESRVEQETTALRAEFALKRKIMLDGLAELGIRPAAEPRGTFYVWASIRDLPAPLNDADAFFHACLSRKDITAEETEKATRKGRFLYIHHSSEHCLRNAQASFLRYF